MAAQSCLALVGGTGLTELDSHFEEIVLETPFGDPSAPIRLIETRPLKLLFLPRHGSPHRFPPHCVNYRANMWALREAGAQQVLAVSAVGGIREPYVPAALAIPDQLIDYSWGREHSYSDADDLPLVHVDFSYPYEGELRAALVQAAAAVSLDVVDGGCIGVFQGPRLESAAEIERAHRDGCHMAGMTSLPEASLARELGLDYAGIAVVSNWAAGVGGNRVCEDSIADTLKEPMTRVRRLVQALVEQMQRAILRDE